MGLQGRYPWIMMRNASKTGHLDTLMRTPFLILMPLNLFLIGLPSFFAEETLVFVF